MHSLDWRVAALSAGSFLAVTYSLCLLGDVLLGQEMWRSWAVFLPGFEALDWANSLYGFFAVFGYGIYGALVFVPLYNFYLKHFAKSRAED